MVFQRGNGLPTASSARQPGSATMGDDPGALRAAFGRDGYVVVRQVLAGRDFAPLR
jgi:hypothetical protein